MRWRMNAQFAALPENHLERMGDVAGEHRVVSAKHHGARHAT